MTGKGGIPFPSHRFGRLLAHKLSVLGIAPPEVRLVLDGYWYSADVLVSFGISYLVERQIVGLRNRKKVHLKHTLNIISMMPYIQPQI